MAEIKESINTSNTSRFEEAGTDLLLEWYGENRRILPWREDPSPYHVWISEIMLQQTRVEAVRPYYARFLETLPTVEDLAAAEEDVYLKLWEGLGYYSRVRNLHRAAVEIVENRGGRIPDNYQDLKSLPGIGEYTAAAIASIAFREAVPAVDGNLLRIFSRLTGYRENILATAAKRQAGRFFSAWISSERPGVFNQALMDLGAMICLPNTAPLCGACPLSALCEAHRLGCETDLPARPEKKKRAVDRMTVLLIHHDRRILLRKRPAGGLLAGLYEFPNTEGFLTEKQALRKVEELGFTALRVSRLPDAKHIFSHREWHMRGFEVFTGDWADPGNRGPFAEETTESYDEEAGSLTAGGQRLFLAKPSELEDIWSIPSAFRAFRDYAGKHE